MAYEEGLKSISLDAHSSIAVYTGVPNQPGSADPNIGHQYKFVKITGRHEAGIADEGGAAVGVLQNKPQVTGQAATVGIFGVSIVRSGGAVAAGESVSVDSTGRGVAASAGTAAVGVAVEAAGDADELFSVLLMPNATAISV